MWPWWDSLEKVARVNDWVLGFAAVFGLCAAALVGGAWFTGKRLASLAEQERAKTKAESDQKIADTNRLAGDANKRAGELEKEAAELKAKNLQLEAAIAPRRLSARQEQALASLTAHVPKVVAIESYSSDTEGLILATQIFDALLKSGITIEDNRLTVIPSGSITFGVSVAGSDKALVDEFKRILSMDDHLTKTSSLTSLSRGGFSVINRTGAIRLATPPVATILVGPKPIK